MWSSAAPTAVNRYLDQGITVPSFRAAHKGLMSHGLLATDTSDGLT
jgi:hypothetical protein